MAVIPQGQFDGHMPADLVMICSATDVSTSENVGNVPILIAPTTLGVGVDDVGGRRKQLRAALQRYTAAMVRHHRQDQIDSKGRQPWLERQ